MDLQRRHVLYDQDASGGTFRHVYTKAFQERFFFEVVERNGGYMGCGATNAAVRIAAQRRAIRAEKDADVSSRNES